MIDAGLIWIGPPPAAIEALGDKVKARHIAQKVGAPLVPGTAESGGRRRRGASPSPRSTDCRSRSRPRTAAAAAGSRSPASWPRSPQLFESATREAVTAFGRGECFVERYLDRPRHVETQCLADTHGNVVVVSTRDCSLQRRHQKLVEEAPAPFLSAEQIDRLYTASKAILIEAGYVGAGTCEFLVGQDGTISFLEVNTRLQVEHPVSEEVTGLDLVREMFRIAEGEPLGYDDPVLRGHSIEFRINAEDAGRNFMPAPGTLTAWQPPAGPGVRVDEGYRAGMTVPGTFDSLVAKIIVTGADRDTALARSRRALGELVVEGMPTVVPVPPGRPRRPRLHRTPTATSGCTPAGSRPSSPARSLRTTARPPTPAEPEEKTKVVVEVNGKRLEVVVPAGSRRRCNGAAPRLGPRSRPVAAPERPGRRPDRPATR